MAKEREFCCTIAAPSIINFENHCICQCNVNGHFPIRHWLTLQASDHIPRKCEIWKHEDYHMNIQSILTSNGFLDISIHIWSCGCDFWKNLLSFSHTNSPKLTGLHIFGQFAHIPRFHSSNISLFRKIISVRTRNQESLYEGKKTIASTYIIISHHTAGGRIQMHFLGNGFIIPQ